MKTRFYFSMFALALLVPFRNPAQIVLTNDSLTMSASYANEIYYSMSAGQVSQFARNTWDIAFRTMKMSSSILTNDGTYVTLWSYPKADTTGWSGIDTVGLANWEPLYNDPDDWENGAFSRHATGHPDYGWGVYNSVTHDVVGDSLFIIQLRDGTYRKIWILRKASVEDIYYFRYANVDGTDPQEVTLDCNPYIDRDFIGFSLITNEVVDFQPPKDSWDLVFTKYNTILPEEIPMIVTGVLSNDRIRTNQFDLVPQPIYNNWSAAPWDSTRSAIGYDWKTFDMGTMTYTVDDGRVYFVKDYAGDVYKLYFTKFEGSATGKVCFTKGRVSASGIGEGPAADLAVSVFPNPADDHFTLSLKENMGTGRELSLTDLQGRTVFRQTLEAGTGEYRISTLGLNNGLYLLTLAGEGSAIIKKVVVSH